MQRTKAPFRADEVGSLLRPPRIKEARAKLEKGEISADDLRKVEDIEIEKVVHKQASIGLKLATDGEFRRSWWHFDFLAKLTGCELFHPDEGIQFAGIQTRHDAVRVIGRLDFPDYHRIAERPADMTITTHVCRGNFRSTWISSGGYEPVAETLLAGTNYDGYFLEYDSERAGGFEPLRFLPKGNKIVVVGVITSKTGELEKKDDVKRRLEEASKFVSLDQLALSPQCGFASTEEGNILTEDEQWAKLKLAVDVANEVWGKEALASL